MKQFDVQRVESLMRYAEFLRDMNANQDKIDQVIELIHCETVGYNSGVTETICYADGSREQYNFLEVHPVIERYVQEQIKGVEKRCQRPGVDWATGEDKTSFLAIELDNEDSTLPRVFHEGKEITNKVRVHFDWKTRTDQPGKLEVNVEYYKLEDQVEPRITGIGIEKLT